MKARTQRLLILGFMLSVFATSAFYMLYLLKDNVTFFYNPSELMNKDIPLKKKIRLGGMVKEGSVEQKGATVKFIATDFTVDIIVEYEGILPDLFREGQGVVAEGWYIYPNHFKADKILAKHDENYMPPQIQQKTEGRE